MLVCRLHCFSFLAFRCACLFSLASIAGTGLTMQEVDRMDLQRVPAEIHSAVVYRVRAEIYPGVVYRVRAEIYSGAMEWSTACQPRHILEWSTACLPRYILEWSTTCGPRSVLEQSNGLPRVCRDTLGSGQPSSSSTEKISTHIRQPCLWPRSCPEGLVRGPRAFCAAPAFLVVPRPLALLHLLSYPYS